jgi:hypothetical protein
MSKIEIFLADFYSKLTFHLVFFYICESVLIYYRLLEMISLRNVIRNSNKTLIGMTIVFYNTFIWVIYFVKADVPKKVRERVWLKTTITCCTKVVPLSFQTALPFTLCFISIDNYIYIFFWTVCIGE